MGVRKRKTRFACAQSCCSNMIRNITDRSICSLSDLMYYDFTCQIMLVSQMLDKHWSFTLSLCDKISPLWCFWQGRILPPVKVWVRKQCVLFQNAHNTLCWLGGINLQVLVLWSTQQKRRTWHWGCFSHSCLLRQECFRTLLGVGQWTFRQLIPALWNDCDVMMYESRSSYLVVTEIISNFLISAIDHSLCVINALAFPLHSFQVFGKSQSFVALDGWNTRENWKRDAWEAPELQRSAEQTSSDDALLCSVS